MHIHLCICIHIPAANRPLPNAYCLVPIEARETILIDFLCFHWFQLDSRPSGLVGARKLGSLWLPLPLWDDAIGQPAHCSIGRLLDCGLRGIAVMADWNLQDWEVLVDCSCNLTCSSSGRDRWVLLWPVPSRSGHIWNGCCRARSDFVERLMFVFTQIIETTHQTRVCLLVHNQHQCWSTTIVT